MGLTLLEHRIQPRLEVRTDEPVEILPSINARNLAKHSLDPTINSANPENMATRVR